MKIKELKRFKTEGAPTGVCATDTALYFCTVNSAELCSIDLKTGRRSALADTGLSQPIGLSCRDKAVVFLDSANRVLYRTGTARYAPERLIDLNNLDLAGFNPALQSKGAEIGDVCLRGSELLLVVIAGHSSGVYQIDLNKARATGFFFSNGPQPRGVVQDEANELIYVADAGAGYLVQFKTNGRFTGNAAKLPTAAPQGLDTDSTGLFYVGARDAGEIIQFALVEQ